MYLQVIPVIIQDIVSILFMIMGTFYTCPLHCINRKCVEGRWHIKRSLLTFLSILYSLCNSSHQFVSFIETAMNNTEAPWITGGEGGTDHPDKGNHGWSIGEIENSVLVRVIYGIIAVIGVTGNLLVCLVLMRVPSLRSNTSVFLVHLAVVDLIVCIWAVPFHLFPHVPDPTPGVWGDIKCRLYSSKFPLWTFALISICSLVTVNLERFIAIVYPIKYKNIYTRRNTCLMICVCWVVGIISNSYCWYIYGNDSTGICIIFGWQTKGFQILLGLYNFVAYYLAPFTFMVATQWKVINTLKRQARILQEKRQRTGELTMTVGDICHHLYKSGVE